MVENHIKHETEAKFICLTDHCVRIVHRTEHRIDGIIIGDIIAIVIHRTSEKWREPHVIDTKVLQIRELRPDAVQVADAVAVRVAEGLDIDLVDCANSGGSSFLLYDESGRA